jgi:hypothetical protein
VIFFSAGSDNLPRENGSINDVNVVSAIDLCVGVNDGGTASKTAISAHLGRSDPVVGAAGTGSLGQLIDRQD